MMMMMMVMMMLMVMMMTVDDKMAVLHYTICASLIVDKCIIPSGGTQRSESLLFPDGPGKLL